LKDFIRRHKLKLFTALITPVAQFFAVVWKRFGEKLNPWTFGRRGIRSFCILKRRVYFGKSLSAVPDGAIIFFPFRANTLFCGLAGIVAIKKKSKAEVPLDIDGLREAIQKIEAHGYLSWVDTSFSLDDHYLCGDDAIAAVFRDVRTLKTARLFYDIFLSKEAQDNLQALSQRLAGIIETEEHLMAEHAGHLASDTVESLSGRIECLKDIHWCLSVEILGNLEKITDLMSDSGHSLQPSVLNIYNQINTVLNSIDRLEVRGRDSAGLSLMFVLEEPTYKTFMETIERAKLTNGFSERAAKEVLLNNAISINETAGEGNGSRFAMALTYKVAAEIGSLGDNIRFIRKQIQNDRILKIIAALPHQNHTVLSHTRWASMGAITEANCHPVDNNSIGGESEKSGIIHVCLNGDIDNYRALKKAIEQEGITIHQDVTTDTKIIPLQMEKYLKRGHGVADAFRLAVNDFEGSHAISMHSDLAPGKFFIAQKGSGQAVFVGLAAEHYLVTSEVYGFVEETTDYLKMDGEITIEGKDGKTQGQIFILDQGSAGGLEGLRAMFYDGTLIQFKQADVKRTDITSRDIDRQDFPHYFLKEISESPISVERTLLNRWKISSDNEKHYVVSLDETVIPDVLKTALRENIIKRVFFVGQGTAGVAAAACADLLYYYLQDPSFQMSALKASELSGFRIGERDGSQSMADALVVAISQSGTTTDTNRTIDMVRERGAHTLAIVNRRDSDITFKVDGVMYTSSGRDIEMSVASTKAFYAQIIAGALLGLYIASLKGRREGAFVTEEIKQLLEIPTHMRTVLAIRDKIAESASRLAVTKTYWAAVGSGPNKIAADEIRIKLSELCYKTISSDFVEDKKHIDLSSEPLIIVCAAGMRDTVIGDIVKDTAIFQAHKATPVVIADEGDTRFDLYAEDVFHVPNVSEHLSPILNTLVGHLWGYYAALAINEGSRFLYRFREDMSRTIDDFAKKGLDVYEVVLERSFREKIAAFYNELRNARTHKRLPSVMGMDAATDLILLLKYLSGRLPISDFELDFDMKGTANNMLARLFACLGEAINVMARPVDAIKHQAKTVTVGTSRIREKVEGILFEALEKHHIGISQLINSNIIVLKNLQAVISDIKGAIVYRVSGLNMLGELTDDTTIEVVRKEGVLKPIPSRVESDIRLKGTKRIIVRQGNVYIGKGRKDDRSIIVIPVISTSPSTANMIEYLLLLNISFKTDVPLSFKAKALGGKYEHIKNIVQENTVAWQDEFLELVAMEDLFGRSAEKVGESIISNLDAKLSA